MITFLLYVSVMAVLYVIGKRLDRPNAHKITGAHGLVWCSRCGADEGLLGDCPGTKLNHGPS